MTTQNGKSKERVEQLLRAWGSEKAVRGEQSRLYPRLFGTEEGRPGRRWVAVAGAAAGAAILAAALTAVLLGPRSAGDTEAIERKVSGRVDQERLRIEAAFKDRLAARDGEVRDAERRLRELEAKHRRLVETLDHLTPQIKPVHRDNRAAYVSVLEKQGAKALAERLADASERLDTLQKAFGKELTRLNLARLSAEARAARFEARQKEARDLLAAAYVKAQAPGLSGLPALRKAGAGLLDRAQTTSKQLRHAAVRQVFREVEAALKSADPADRKKLSELVGRTDKVLSDRDEAAAVRKWLFEAQFVLTALAAQDKRP